MQRESEECLTHALSMTRIFSAILYLDRDLPLVDSDSAVCAYHCKRIILFCSDNKIGRILLTTEMALRVLLNACRQSIRLFGLAAGTRVTRRTPRKDAQAHNILTLHA